MDINPLSIIYNTKSVLYEYPSLTFSVSGNTASILSTITNVLASNLPSYPILILPTLDKSNVKYKINLQSVVIASIEDQTTNPWPIPITNYVYGGISSNNYIKTNGAPLKQLFLSNSMSVNFDGELSKLALENIELIATFDIGNMNTGTFATFTQSESTQIFMYINPIITATWL